ncbi:MAG: hypothetical protein IIC88_06575, partial [Chloroflexi bacterium]|nr:hypothetical protein [Chloroflexota bacterium]
TSGAGLALAGYIIFRAGQTEPRKVRLVPVRGGGKPTATATAPAGAEGGSSA